RGEAALEALAKRIKADGVKNPLVLHYPGALSNAKIKAFAQSLSGILFDKFIGEPTLSLEAECYDIYMKNNCDGVVSVGGGSVLDCGKVLSLCAGNKEKDPDNVCSLAAEPEKAVPFYAVPTTAGTGSETTLFALLTDERKTKKEPYISDKFLPLAVALDASLTVGLPCGVTAATGIDALSHAVEAYVSLFASSFEDDIIYAPKAVKLIFDNLKTVCNEPENLTARQNMLDAANFAGMAFRRISTGYIHAIAHRLGEMCHIPHGTAISMAFVPVLRAYLPYAEKELAALAKETGIAEETDGISEAAEKFINAVQVLISALPLKAEISLTEEEINECVLRAQDEVKIVGYPRPFSDKRLAQLFKTVIE
ncbi:MAG: iron-containing alcohol dehydrogenase, partial [Clostridia bacterium]|nr:iron-containing alcohol dehydrogenase [Clostridia bacterium]